MNPSAPLYCFDCAPVHSSRFLMISAAPPRPDLSATPTLSNGVPVAATTDPANFTIPAGSRAGRWACAPPTPGLDLNALDVTAPFPSCFHGALANSSGGGIDFAVTDWRFRFPQDDYVRVGTGGSTGTSALVEYEQPSFEYQSNRPFDQIFIDASDVITVRETDMQAGIRYFFQVSPSAGLSGLRFFLFEPVTAGTGWVPRSSRVFEIGLFDGTGTCSSTRRARPATES
jgi:hypothetical protein